MMFDKVRYPIVTIIIAAAVLALTVSACDNPAPEPGSTATPALLDTPTLEPLDTPAPEPSITTTPALPDTPMPEPLDTPTPKPSRTPTLALLDTPTPEPLDTPTPRPRDPHASVRCWSSSPELCDPPTPVPELRRTSAHDTPLHRAARSGLGPKAKVLLDGGADIDARNGDVLTPLHLAIQHGSNHDGSNREVIALLLEHGADVNAQGRIKDSSGYYTSTSATPLHFAIHYGSSLEVITLLLEHGANVQAIDGSFNVDTGERGDEETALHMAAAREDSAPEIVRLLLEYGANVRARDIYGNTPLHYVSSGGANPEVIRLLIEYGADVNAINNQGDSPIHFIVSHAQDTEAISILLERGADINAKGYRDNTPLHLATEGTASVAVIAKLLEHGADVNAVGNKYLILSHHAGHRATSPRTPLQLAAENFYSVNPDVIALLLEHGADPNPNHDDRHAEPPLYYMALRGASFIDTTKLLLEHGADPNARVKYDLTLLHLVLDPAVTEILLEHGADPNAVGKYHYADNFAYTPLLYIIGKNRSTELRTHPPFTELITLLLDHGADIHARIRTGDTPLHLAVGVRHVSATVVETLLDLGADPSARNYYGEQTPLHVLIESYEFDRGDQHASIVRLLLHHGADLDAKDGEGRTPCEIARQRNEGVRLKEIRRLVC